MKIINPEVLHTEPTKEDKAHCETIIAWTIISVILGAVFIIGWLISGMPLSGFIITMIGLACLKSFFCCK